MTSNGTVMGRRSSVTSQRTAVIALGAVVLSFVVVSGLLLIWFWITGTEAALLVAGSISSLVVLLAPQLRARRYDLFQPLTFVAWSVLLGVCLRTIYVVLVDDSTTRDYLMLGQDIESLIPAVTLMLLGLACLILGYAVRAPRVDLSRLYLVRNHEWHVGRLLFLVVLLVGVSVGATLGYFERMDIGALTLETLSRKRRLVVEGAEYRFAALGYYLWGSRLVAYAFYLTLAYVLATRARLRSVAGVAAVVLGLASTILPVVTSSRTEALLPLVYAALIWHYQRNALKVSSIALSVVMALSVLVVLGGLRAMGQGRIDTVGDTFGIEAVLGTRHWMDVTKTAHILAAVPAREEFQNGRTLVSWAYAPIPRTLWPDKPVIRSGQIIGQIVYEGQFVKTGVPPGFVAELYWNFGRAGVLIGMFFLGVFLRFLYGSLRPYLHDNRNVLLVYMGIMVPFALLLPGGDLSGTVLQAAMHVITVVALLYFVSAPPRMRPANARAGRRR